MANKSISGGSEGNLDFGLFSGGGQSMQVGLDGVARSLPLSTWWEPLDEKKGATEEAWRDETASQ